MRGRFRFLSRSIAAVALAMFAGGCPRRRRGGPAAHRLDECLHRSACCCRWRTRRRSSGLSRYSRDAWQSFAAGDARRYPILSGGAEDVLVLKPDVVVASLFDKRSTRELLKAQGLHLAEFSVPRNLDEVKAQIRRDGRNHRPSRSRRGGNRPARCRDGAGAPGRRPTSIIRVLPLSRRGWVSGRDSLVSSLLSETGLFNAAGELGVTSGGYRLARGDRECKARFSSGVGGRRPRRG